MTLTVHCQLFPSNVLARPRQPRHETRDAHRLLGVDICNVQGCHGLLARFPLPTIIPRAIGVDNKAPLKLR